MVKRSISASLSSVDVVLKLIYLNSSDILHSVVNGTLARIDVNDKNAYTKSVEILGLSLRNYVYTLINKEVENHGFGEYGDCLAQSKKSG